MNTPALAAQAQALSMTPDAAFAPLRGCLDEVLR